MSSQRRIFMQPVRLGMNAWREFWEGPRARRVAILIVGIILLSIGDLLLTLHHLRSIGMAEANPLARWIIEETQSAAALSAFKVLSIVLSCGLLYALRIRRSAELACWFGFGVLVALGVAWHRYGQTVTSVDPAQFVHVASDSSWVTLP